MNRLYVLTIFITSLFIFPACAGNSLNAKTYPFADSSAVELKILHEDSFEVYLDNDEFDYGINLSLNTKNTFGFRLSELLRKLWDQLRSMFAVLPVLFHIFLWGLVLFSLIILITKTNLNRIFYSNKDTNVPEYNVLDTEESISDFDSAIQNELQRKEYRKAIRLMYLKIIHKLEQVELINYSKEKTNIDYLRELHDTKIKNGFLSLTGIYNNVWYGHFEINESQYQQYERNFDEFLNSIDV